MNLQGTELLLVRHGETEWNVLQKVQGRHDSPLTARGQEAARLLGKRLAQPGVRRPVAVYCSPLGRARHTADIVAGALGLDAVPTAGVVERGYGIFEGLTPAEQAERYPAEFSDNRRREVDYALPGGGESRSVAAERAERALLDIVHRHAGQRVLVVVHSGLLMALMSRVLGLAPNPNPRVRALLCPNTSVNVLRWVGEAWTLVLWGDTAEFTAPRDQCRGCIAGGGGAMNVRVGFGAGFAAGAACAWLATRLLARRAV